MSAVSKGFQIEDKRDENGLFLPGTKPGPGNPFAADVSRLKKVCFAAVTDERLAQMMSALLDKGIAGDPVCGRLVLEYTIGKPVQEIAAAADGGSETVIILRGHAAAAMVAVNNGAAAMIEGHAAEVAAGLPAPTLDPLAQCRKLAVDSFLKQREYSARSDAKKRATKAKRAAISVDSSAILTDPATKSDTSPVAE